MLRRVHRLGFGPVFRQVDEVHQFTQASLVTAVEGEGQAGQVVEVADFMFCAAVGLLMVFATQAQVGEALLNVV